MIQSISNEILNILGYILWNVASNISHDLNVADQSFHENHRRSSL